MPPVQYRGKTQATYARKGPAPAPKTPTGPAWLKNLSKTLKDIGARLDSLMGKPRMAGSPGHVGPHPPAPTLGGTPVPANMKWLYPGNITPAKSREVWGAVDTLKRQTYGVPLRPGEAARARATVRQNQSYLTGQSGALPIQNQSRIPPQYANVYQGTYYATLPAMQEAYRQHRGVGGFPTNLPKQAVPYAPKPQPVLHYPPEEAYYPETAYQAPGYGYRGYSEPQFTYPPGYTGPAEYQRYRGQVPYGNNVPRWLQGLVTWRF